MTRLFVIFAIFHCAKGNMTVTPRNTVVLAGDRVELECRVDSNSRVYRWELMNGTKNVESIVRIDKNSTVVTISHLGVNVDSTGSGVIYYNSTDLKDAGNYSCRAHIGTDEETIIYSAQLIVLEYLPNCSSNYSSDNDYPRKMQCTLNFRGFWSPTMEWRRHDGSEEGDGRRQEVEGDIESVTIPNSHVMSSLTVSRNSLGEGTYFSCRTYFKRTFDGILLMNATNIPEFVYVWNSSVYSSDHTTSKASWRHGRHREDREERRREEKKTLLVQVWSSVGVALTLMVIIVAVTSGCYMRNLMKVKRERLQEQKKKETENVSCSASPAYASDNKPEFQTYAEIDESQISPVDYPPNLTPRFNKKPDDSITCIGLQEPDGNGEIAETGPIYHTLDSTQSVLSPSIVESQVPSTL